MRSRRSPIPTSTRQSLAPEAASDVNPRRSPLHPNFRAIEAVYSNPTIQERFPPSELRRRRRLAEIDAFWTGARNEYVQGRMLKFLAYMVVGTLRYPDSILRPRLVYLFLRGLRQQIVPQTDAPTNL